MASSPSNVIPITDLPVLPTSENRYLVTADLQKNQAGLSYIPDIIAASDLISSSIEQVTSAAIESAQQVLASLGYLVPVEFQSGLVVDSTRFTVSYNGQVYAPNVDSIPFTTNSNFVPSDWRLIQGISSTDLSQGYGSGMVGYESPGASAFNRTVSNKLREIISVKDFGAIGDGALHPLSERFSSLAQAKIKYPHAVSLSDQIDWAAWQSAVNYAQSVSTPNGQATNCEVHVPHGCYLVNRTISVSTPISIIGSGYGDIPTNNPDGTGRAISVVLATNGLEDNPIFRVTASTVGEVLVGGRFKYIQCNGQGIASHGFYGSSLSHWEIDAFEARCRVAGMRLDDGNGTLNSFNEIRNRYVSGVDSTTINSHGLWIIGTLGDSGGNPQQRIFKNWAYTVNGDNLRFESDVDNAIVYYASGIVTGTGRNLALVSGFSTPRVNTFLYWAGGKALMDINTYGNVIFSTSSEQTTITGSGQYHLQSLVDYGGGGMWQTNRYLLSDELSFTPMDFQQSAAGAGATILNLNSFLPCWTLDASSNEMVATSKLAPKTWRNARIKSVRINYTFNADPGQGRIVVLAAQISTSVSTTGQVVGSPIVKSQLFALPNNVPGSNMVAVINFDTPVVVPNDGMIALGIQRLGADQNDTALGDLYLTGVTLRMESLGPQSGGSGTIVIPPMGT